MTYRQDEWITSDVSKYIALHALKIFISAFNLVFCDLKATIFNNIPKRTIKDKLVKINKQFAWSELRPTAVTGGSSTVRASVSSKWTTQKMPTKWAWNCTLHPIYIWL